MQLAATRSTLASTHVTLLKALITPTTNPIVVLEAIVVSQTNPNATASLVRSRNLSFTTTTKTTVNIIDLR